MIDRSQAVLISGASSGIGAASAGALAKAGYAVYAGVRTTRDAASVCALHDAIAPVTLDVCDDESIARTIAAIRGDGVTLIGVVSNSGIALGAPLEHLPMHELRRQFDVNVFGALALVQAALPLLPERRGRIAFVGSISGRLSMPYIGPYSASKFALRAISDALRVELAPAGMRVALIEPGSVKTPIWRKGRESRERVAALLKNTSRPYYRDAMERIFEQTEREESSGMPVQRVSDAIVHAMAASASRENYLLGTPARLGSLVALLPARWRDRVLRASMRLP